MDTAISHKETRMDNGSDFLVDDFFDICVAVPERLDSRRTIHADGQQFVGGSYLFSYHCISVCIAVCQKSTK